MAVTQIDTRAVVGAAVEEALEAAMNSPYTRYPVYRESLDDIVGILHVRELFLAVNGSGDLKNVQLQTSQAAVIGSQRVINFTIVSDIRNGGGAS